MALGILGIFYLVLIVIGVIAQILLYISKNSTKNSIYIINMLFAIILSYMVYTSLPTNFTSQKVLAIGLGILSILALGLHFNLGKNNFISKIMLSISIIGNFIQLFL